MAWITLTEADALTAVNGRLLTAARTKALAEGQVDPLLDTLAQAIDDVRGSIGACKANSLGPDGTIPSKLKKDTLAIFAVMMLGRLDVEPEKAKVMLFEAAQRKMTAVASCAYAIDEPAEKTDEVLASPTPRIKPRLRRYCCDDY